MNEYIRIPKRTVEKIEKGRRPMEKTWIKWNFQIQEYEEVEITLETGGGGDK